MAEFKVIDSNNVDFFQWGVNSRLIGVPERMGRSFLKDTKLYSQEDRDLFWEGYYSVEEDIPSEYEF